SGAGARRGRLHRYQPVLEVLEDRRLPSGIFIENFTNDNDPSQKGLDTSGMFSHQFVPGPNADIENISTWGIPDPDVVAPSLPFALFVSGGDTITFPRLAAGETVDLAKVAYAPLTLSATVIFQGATDYFTVTSNVPQWHSASVTSAHTGDEGRPVGPI